ncbi:glycosyltransferase [Chryseobacterium joostei]|uniref:Glycosyltransferase n=1 Tax=Chryseobacterium joostei TaxID=112234 RepID=A0A1N7I9T2_9FLAO|nr:MULTISPECIES: glycosyltransferase [Chryseobacterium]AZB01058.1 glycosyltransferase [Chryseobacterium joostei]SIS33780.1 Glycosyltransferase involved in cell wall bisynthesis [Chryseobacterium joostei]HCM35201.1 glycosyltransferase family 4 protein [Chryseobacterium sp.]
MNKRILFVYYQNIKIGGVAKVLTNITSNLADRGYTIEILFLMAPHDDFYTVNPKIKKHYINSFGDKYSQFAIHIREKYSSAPKIHTAYSYLYDWGSYRVFRDWIKENHHNYTTIVTCWYKLATMLSFDKEVSKKTIAWEHSSFRVGGMIYDKMLRKNYRKLKSIVSINKPSVEYYEKLNTTFFIPNLSDGIYEDLTFTPIHEKENIISFAGRLDKTKNAIELVKIFKDTPRPSDWKLQIIGEGSERDNIAAYIRDNKLESSVFLLGPKAPEEVAELLKKSKIFIFSSLSEAFGLVLVEAMFCSNAIISYDCEFGPADIINDKNGFLIPLHDRKMFAEKLELLIHDDERLANLMRSSFEESKKWRKEAILEEWDTLLQ